MNKKVKIECWWTSSENITKRTLDQFSINNNISNINFVTDSSYEWLVICGKVPKHLNINSINKSKTIFFGMEPSWSSNTDKDAAIYSKYICTHNINIFNSKDAIFFEEPNYMFYGGRGDSGWTINNLQNLNFDNKSKDLSIIVTKRRNHCGNANIYDQRVAIGDALTAYNDVDIYGTLWEANKKNVHGETWNKFVGLSDYKFSVAIENASEINYITEKFYDCLLTNTITIYHGAPNVADYFDPDGFVYLNNIYNIDECISIIRNIADDISNQYQKKKNACIKNKNIFLNNHNIINKIKNIIYNDSN
jgi:hypothetical protein